VQKDLEGDLIQRVLRHSIPLEDGIAGIIVPSFAINASPSGKNIVFWKWSDKPPHQVKVIDDSGRLPHNRSSWS